MESFLNFLTAVPYFIILIGLLVFVHEGGHFLFAKLFKVKVHVFSLGFGPRLFGFKKGETEYKVALVPIGGYVKMLGDDPTEKVDEADRGRAFGDKPLFQRFLIIAGGPAMNLIFPLFIHFFAGLGNTEILPAEVGLVVPNTPAYETGVMPGDVITSIDGQEIHSFDDLIEVVSPQPGIGLKFVIRRGDETIQRTITPEPTEVTIILGEKKTVGKVGIGPGYLPSLVGLANPKSVAALAGLKTFDLVVSVNDKPTPRLVDLERELVRTSGKTAVVEVRTLKPDAEPPFFPYEDQFSSKTHKIQLTVPAGTSSLKALGIEHSADFVAHVTKDGAAEKIGLKRGDRLVSIDSKKVGFGQFFSEIEKQPDVEHMLAWTNEGIEKRSAFKPTFIPAGEAADLGIKRDAYDKGFWGLIGRSVLPEKIPNPSLVASAMRYSASETWAGIRLIGIGFKLLFKGEISLRSIGGPIMIGQLAGQAGAAGATSFFWMMALISLNLGLLNLLPIPVLDGGQITFIIIETITRRPISLAIKEKIMLVGVAMLLLLMVFATWNDIARIIIG
jgi:regulator of sigma E protease